MSKVKFFYANGTAYLFKAVVAGLNLSIDNDKIITVNGNVQNPKDLTTATIAGLDGQTVTWDGAPQNDPFGSLLDPDIFDVVRVSYPASLTNMGGSISYGYTQTANAVKKLNPGDPWMVGGYSQGAAVMSSVYNAVRSGELTAWASGFLGGVCFGNPRRQVNYRGEVGGSWSGAWDVAGSTTGGHGSFPTSGSFARLSSCQSGKWIEFAAPNDIFTATGDSTTGLRWTDGNDLFTGLNLADLFDYIANASNLLAGYNAANAVGGVMNTFIDAAGKEFKIGGNGHTMYPFVPPPNSDGSIPSSGDTSYQIALKWLTGKANEWATAPVVLSSSSPGWSTTLIPPAS